MSPMTSMVLGIHYGKRPMRNSMPCSKMTLTLLTFVARCSMCGRVTIVWRLGGGTLISITHSIKIGISLLTVLSWIQEIPPRSFWMPWMTSIGKFRFLSFVVFLVSCFIVSLILITLFFRFTDHNHIKDNFAAKLLRIGTFGKMKPEDFKDLISMDDYKMCKSKMEKNPTSYPLTLNVFVKFFYKVIFLFALVFLLPHVSCIYPYIYFCLF